VIPTKNKTPAIFLMGPTASGKTDLAVHLVQSLPCEIISVDSALIYKDMNIGTAKPDAELLKIAPHRLIDIIDPAESYSVANFCNDALEAMADISQQGKVPLLVGGTMMYYRALYKGLSELPSADEAVRIQLETEAAEKGWHVLHERLAKIDPQAAQRIHPNDPQRLQRALEVYEITGKTLTEHFLEQEQTDFPYNVLQMAISPADRSVLHRRIELRFHQMLEKGFIDEVEGLLARGDMHLDLPSMRCVGYRQALKYLSGDYTYNDMVDRSIIATRQLAKRQLTWLRSNSSINWHESEDKQLFDNVMSSVKELGLG